MRNWKTFTEEELKAIRANPYVKSATAKMIRFTVAFKEEFWRLYNEECQQPVRIMRELGFDPEVIGEKRIAGILIHIREQVNSGEEFRDVRKVPETQTKSDDRLTPSKSLLKMQHKLAYLEQEMEFIKKNILADNEARRRK
ncbi:MAG: hypothetical protein DDT21_00216 [Syntrophomonadaceae bacterium]|nr:hypothetical protein [Bacillota bacterium]